MSNSTPHGVKEQDLRATGTRYITNPAWDAREATPAESRSPYSLYSANAHADPQVYPSFSKSKAAPASRPHLCEQLKTEGIVTGEAIGEQASQTLTNLRVLDAVVKKYPVHRPLLGFDKQETEAIGRKIGTYEPSSKKAAPCTAVPYQPSTKAKMEDVLKAEEKLNIEKMVERSLESIKIVEL